MGRWFLTYAVQCWSGGFTSWSFWFWFLERSTKDEWHSKQPNVRVWCTCLWYKTPKKETKASTIWSVWRSMGSAPDRTSTTSSPLCWSWSRVNFTIWHTRLRSSKPLRNSRLAEVSWEVTKDNSKAVKEGEETSSKGSWAWAWETVRSSQICCG